MFSQAIVGPKSPRVSFVDDFESHVDAQDFSQESIAAYELLNDIDRESLEAFFIDGLEVRVDDQDVMREFMDDSFGPPSNSGMSVWDMFREHAFINNLQPPRSKTKNGNGHIATHFDISIPPSKKPLPVQKKTTPKRVPFKKAGVSLSASVSAEKVEIFEVIELETLKVEKVGKSTINCDAIAMQFEVNFFQHQRRRKSRKTVGRKTSSFLQRKRRSEKMATPQKKKMPRETSSCDQVKKDKTPPKFRHATHGHPRQVHCCSR